MSDEQKKQAKQATARTFTPKEIAQALGVDQKTLRNEMRKLTKERVGRGGHWLIDEAMAAKLVERVQAKRRGRTAYFTIDDES